MMGFRVFKNGLKPRAWRIGITRTEAGGCFIELGPWDLYRSGPWRKN